MIPPLLAIFSWPLVVITLFQKKAPATALALSLICGYLLLPNGQKLDLPLLPAFDKHTIPVFSALIMVMVLSSQIDAKQMLAGFIPKSPLLRVLIATFIFGSFMTVVTNGDPLVYGPKTLPGLRLYDGFSAILTAILFLLPMLLARKFLARPQDHILLLKILCIAGLCYSLLALYEVRMSPQINQTTYGFFPHSWVQHRRGGSWRPIVFLNHGLWVSIFFSATVLAALGIWRSKATEKPGLFLLAGGWLLLTLIATKSLGALAITLMLMPIVLFMPRRLQLMAAFSIGLIVLLYPMVRGTGWVPVEEILQYVSGVNSDRAASLFFRIQNEDILLAHANERPVFGWGGWGRSLVSDQTGRTITVADGYWVIVIGLGGWVRYLSEFGLLCAPLILLFLRGKKMGADFATTTIALILAGNLIDLIPNGTNTPLTWLFVGALWGRLELGAVQDSPDEEMAAEPTRAQHYRRKPQEKPPREPIRPKRASAEERMYTRQVDRKNRYSRGKPN